MTSGQFLSSMLKYAYFFFFSQCYYYNVYKDGESMNVDKENLGQNLAYAALDEIPTPKGDAKEIVGLVKSGGKITGYQLSDGRMVSKQEGVDMAKNGEIGGVGIAHRKNSEYLKALPDGKEDNNLGNLPSVSK